MGSSQKKKKRTEDTRSMTSEVKRAQDQDIVKAVVEPELEVGFGPVGVGTKSFVDVSSNIVVGVQTNAGTVDTTPPAQVTGLVVTVAGPTQLNLTWTASAASDLNHYNVYRGTTSGFTVTPGVTSPLATPVTNSYNDATLSASTPYYYKVLAADHSGNLGALSAQGTATTAAIDTTPPAQVVGLSVTAVTVGQLNLTWTASGASDLDHYNVYRGTVTGFSVTPGTTFPLAQPTTNSFNDTPLAASTTYYYKVLAVDTSGNLGAISAQGSATTIAPDAIPPAQVTGLVVSSVTATSIKLNWTANIESDLHHYNVYRSTVAGFTVTPGTTVPLSQPTTPSYVSGGLTALTTYYFKVAAVDSSGNIGTLSSEVSGTTIAATAFAPNLWLQLDNNFTDSANGIVLSASSPSGFSTRSVYGSACLNFRYPDDTKLDFLYHNTPPAHLDFDPEIGFSVSLWIFPTDVTMTVGPRFVIGRRIDENTGWSIQIDSSNKCYFFVKKDGTDYKTENSGFTLNKWHHIVAIFNGQFNLVYLYHNGIPSVTTTVTPDFNNDEQATAFFVGSGFIANRIFEGMIDEIQYYKSQILNLTHVLNLMNTNTPDTTFPVPLTFYNGTTDFVSTPDAANLDLNNFTVLAWVRTAKNYSAEGMIIDKGGIGNDSAGENMNYGIYIMDVGEVGRVLFETSAGVDNNTSSVTGLNDGETHLLIATYNGTSLILYTDNVTSSLATTSIPEVNAQPLVVGRNSRDSTRFFEGWIGDPQVWNRAWNSTEAANYFNNLIAPSDTTARVYLLTAFQPDIWHTHNSITTDSGKSGIQVIPSSGMIGSYDTTNKKFGSASINFNPSSTTGYYVLPTGAEYTQLDFDNKGFSFSFWIRPTEITALCCERHIMNWYSNGNKVTCFIWTDGKLGTWAYNNRAAVGEPNKGYAKLYQSAVSVNTWYHVVITFDPSQALSQNKLRLYVNKVIDSGDVSDPSIFATSGEIKFGNLSVSGAPCPVSPTTDAYFRGQFDEFMFFRNRLLSQNNVNSLYDNNLC